MITSVVRTFKNVASEGFPGLIARNVPVRTTNFRWSSQMMKSDLVTNKELIKDPKFFIRQFLKENENPESINWDKLEKKLIKLNVKNHRKEILQSCQVLQNLEASISYFNYLTKKGEELTPFESVLLMKSLNKKGVQISKYENVVEYLYDKVKDNLNDSAVLQSYVLKTASAVSSCFHDIIKSASEQNKNISNYNLIKKAFELKDEKLAYELMNKNTLNKNIFEYYINYLCNIAIEGKFHPQLLTKFTEFCESNMNVLCFSETYALLKTLVDTLTKHSNYKWTLKQSVISENNTCLCCKMKLIDKCISQSDFELLKNSFLGQAGLMNLNVFISSTDTELKNFSYFLKNARPYNVVLDGMNLLYKNKANLVTIQNVLKYFIERDFRVLMISKAHSDRKILRLPIFESEKYTKKCLFFFTDNLSDDDVFLIYAALHGGLKTYICSGDFLQCYTARLDNNIKNIYIKWKLYHQYMVKGFQIIPPWPSIGVPQLTSKENDNFTWHFPYYSEEINPWVLNTSIQLKWICLQAHKKSLQQNE